MFSLLFWDDTHEDITYQVEECATIESLNECKELIKIHTTLIDRGNDCVSLDVVPDFTVLVMSEMLPMEELHDYNLFVTRLCAILTIDF